MGHSPQSAPTEQPYYFFPDLEAMDSSQELDPQAHSWMMATVIEDDDLQFGGKSLSTWYEEDRRRCSFTEENGSAEAYREEEERRGRQRDRPHRQKSSHKHQHHHSKSSKSSGGEKKKH